MHRIIVGVKYCFRYNARNRALRNGEEVDPINLENMPTRPHRRRREKKLMTMDEVNERFPLTKYKNWVASRAREGLPTSGGVTAPPSRAGSVRLVEGIMPSSPTGTKQSTGTRPNTSGSDDGEAAEIMITPATIIVQGEFGGDRKSMEAKSIEEGIASPTVEDQNHLETVHTTTSTVDKHITTTSENDDDEDDHIHTAVPPELLSNPGDSCAICIDTLEDDDDIRGLTCGHAFHAGCLDPWLTSRRACCPLCKADYYIPKPRPEGEAADTSENTRRSRRERANMPQPPQSAWTGIRNPRLVFPGRLATPAAALPGDSYGLQQSRIFTRRRTGAGGAESEGVANTSEAAGPRVWLPRISNPFRRNQAAPAEQTASPDPTPAQLEAGVTR